MLFVFPEPGDQRRDFWMKDTIAPLDMVFVRADGTVSSVAARVPATKPGTPDDRIARRNGIGRFVIELAAGGAAAAGLKPGSRLTCRRCPPTDHVPYSCVGSLVEPWGTATVIGMLALWPSLRDAVSSAAACVAVGGRPSDVGGEDALPRSRARPVRG